jgi:hypothetical protein
MTELLEQLPALPPLQFFSVEAVVKYGKEIKKGHLLPEFTDLLGEVHFTDVSLAWNEEAVLLQADIKKPFEEAFYPDYEKGDALEFFFDTRDLKTAGVPTKFCHHFLILPKEVQGIRVQELSKFRAEDSHPLCDGDDIFVQAEFTSRSYRIEAAFPASVLYGYDPLSFDRLGFTYRFHRSEGDPQHFAVSSLFYKIEQQPSLWATLKLAR